MNHRVLERVSLLLSLVLALGTVMACGPRQTPEERLAYARSRHDIRPVGYTTIHSEDGQPITLVDIDLTNKSATALPQLTVLVRIVGADGSKKYSERVTLDLEGVRPGTGVQTAVNLLGIETVEGDELFVELEAGLTPEDLRSLPEFQAVAGES